MTVLTRASDMGCKPDLFTAPLVDDPFDPERVVGLRKTRTHHVWVHRTSRCHPILSCFSLFVLSMVLICAVLGIMYYTTFHENVRYKGYCTIPITVPRDIMMQDARLQKQIEAMRMPLRWTDDPDLTVYTTVDEAATGDALNSLLERFDIDGNVETISIFDSGNKVEFIHDFNVNATGIVEQKRCFTMELDGGAVLSPGVLVLSIQRGAAFDVRRVRQRLRARLPPAAAPALLAERCAGRPVYELEQGNDIIRRKRSPDEPAHEFMHFAGKNIQEISIDNLDELLEYEKKLAA